MASTSKYYMDDAYSDPAFDPYTKQRDDARARLLGAVTKSGNAQRGMLSAQQRQQDAAQMTADRTGAGGLVAQGAMLGMPFGGVGMGIGAGAGALMSGAKSFDAHRKQGKGVLGSLVGAAGDVINPSNLIGGAMQSPAAMPLAMGAASALAKPPQYNSQMFGSADEAKDWAALGNSKFRFGHTG